MDRKSTVIRNFGLQPAFHIEIASMRGEVFGKNLRYQAWADRQMDSVSLYILYRGLFSNGKIFANAQCGDLLRVKISRMFYKELTNNHKPMFSRGKYSQIKLNW